MACSVDPTYQGRSSSDWIALLSDPDPAERERAAYALGRILSIQPNSRRVVAALVTALRDTADGVREAAAGALATPEVPAEEAMPYVVELLEDSAHAHVREHGAMIIGAFGARAASAVPALLSALDDSVPQVRAAAAGALRRIGPAAAAAAPALRPHMSDPHVPVRLELVRTIPEIRAAAPVSVRLLAPALRDAHPEVRAASARALGDVTTAADGQLDSARADAVLEVLPDLLRALDDDEPAVRANAAFAIGRLGPRASHALDALRRLERDDDPSVRAGAVRAIAAVEGRPLPPAPHQEPRPTP
jgi:HEAT repeat protein